MASVEPPANKPTTDEPTTVGRVLVTYSDDLLPSIPEEKFRCSVCLFVPTKEGVINLNQCGCLNVLCSNCVGALNKRECPTCRSTFEYTKIGVWNDGLNPFFREPFGNIKVHCRHKCGKITTVSDEPSHALTCCGGEGKGGTPPLPLNDAMGTVGRPGNHYKESPPVQDPWGTSGPMGRLLSGIVPGGPGLRLGSEETGAALREMMLDFGQEHAGEFQTAGDMFGWLSASGRRSGGGQTFSYTSRSLRETSRSTSHSPFAHTGDRGEYHPPREGHQRGGGPSTQRPDIPRPSWMDASTARGGSSNRQRPNEQREETPFERWLRTNQADPSQHVGPPHPDPSRHVNPHPDPQHPDHSEEQTTTTDETFRPPPVIRNGEAFPQGMLTTKEMLCSTSESCSDRVNLFGEDPWNVRVHVTQFGDMSVRLARPAGHKKDTDGDSPSYILPPMSVYLKTPNGDRRLLHSVPCPVASGLGEPRFLSECPLGEFADEAFFVVRVAFGE
jgi:hypothetical protein